MKRIKPNKLIKGDTIGIISPASAPLDLERINKGIIYLEKLGYKVKEGNHIRKGYGYLSASDKERIEDIHQMFSDKNVKAIFCTRGGYGTPRLLDGIDYSLIKKNPKIFVGYSDITALQLAIFRKTGLITFSGAMVCVEMHSNFDHFEEELFWRMLTSTKKLGKITNPDNEAMIASGKGKAKGIILGGNLSLIITLMGTGYIPKFKERILFFEDVEEEPYRIDRFFSQLKNSGILDKISGLIIGQLTDCEPKDKTKPSLSLDQVFADYLSDFDKPIIKNVRFGHLSRKLTIPNGIIAKISANKGRIEFLESAVKD